MDSSGDGENGCDFPLFAGAEWRRVGMERELSAGAGERSLEGSWGVVWFGMLLMVGQVLAAWLVVALSGERDQWRAEAGRLGGMVRAAEARDVNASVQETEIRRLRALDQEVRILRGAVRDLTDRLGAREVELNDVIRFLRSELEARQAEIERLEGKVPAAALGMEERGGGGRALPSGVAVPR